MKLEHAELYLVRLPLKFRFETSFGTQTERTLLLLILSGEGLEGYSEGVMEVLPAYREETLAGALHLLETALLPAVLGKDWENPDQLVQALAPFRGNRMAKAVVEMAFWDLWAKSLGFPLYQLLGGVRREVPVGVSLGIQPSLEATLDLVERHLAEGYQRIKLKIKPGWDVQVVAAVRERFPTARLTVDANSAYTLADLPVFRELDRYALDYIEQPLAYDDLVDHAKLQQALTTPLCLDESITSATEARKALELGAGRVINLKVGRVGGHLEARKVHDVAAAWSAPVWCGGMLEAGVGRAHNIHLATLANFTHPGDTSSASRYWAEDIVEEALEAREGWMPVPEGPGIGVTLRRDWIRKRALEVRRVRS
ncbi:o-succinylbenzoate synthase [Marinithermus hydrothermalis]|uniref:o-succinylbenzoate synthase n=1 Tax=Marinithermus hydrothermalis (strain DSM 14884 / JCM 11576 / T1) TaxID=869210 RepID=F2NNH9_MARHT|nr:o-succinylbenzoate synthase [Marinithermus hydrothermalis]AEB10789.1 o-succinylbenzoic acid (OSB) synthetase [Marinithermus hydrothermalis DSM 14884]